MLCVRSEVVHIGPVLGTGDIGSRLRCHMLLQALRKKCQKLNNSNKLHIRHDSGRGDEMSYRVHLSRLAVLNDRRQQKVI